ncbi:thiamine pyrophosphate-dependent dehydrogenase E1 component subunit alpha [Chakrabartyella piscis]|uniref:thiamine pyrophosphate-dependent dehydrogenase E1 component subunit alpha n=1 Tax=Chakrabartyella piscis TaxID=2918914 RepID=UPI0029587487|nr:thiamine pyrophosphate-dependent dehydrogenase E1 component subunit alpha [Chakrabartyella piscis]
MKKIAESVKQMLPTLTPLEAPEGMTKEEMTEIFYKMSLIREFDSSVKDLWMAGEIYGLAHSYVGAEAIGVGACMNLEKTDFISSTHRGHGHTIAKGGDVKAMMAELYGKYEGSNKGKGGSMHIADIGIGMLGATGIVGSGMPTAVGAALTSDVLDNGSVAVCFHGDGGTNQGVWHESMNLAAAWNLPCIFLTENNHLAIKTKLNESSKETELYKRAIGYGIEGIAIDGFNVFEVYKTMKYAVEKARNGGGPTLVEARFVRILGHFVADDQKYRDPQEEIDAWTADPVRRIKEYLYTRTDMFTQEEVDQIAADARAKVDEAIEYARHECTEPPADSLYTDIYANNEVIL